MNHAFVAGSGPGAVSFSYGHDAGGKTTTIGVSQPAFEWLPSLSYARSYGVANVLNQVASETDSVTSRQLTFNPDGNLVQELRTPVGGGSTQTWTYGWTYGNRMISANGPGMTAAYDYDSDDRRTKKTVNGVVTRTMWSGADELAEYDVNGDLIRRFVPDGTGAMDARLATVTPANAVYWHHVDHQGTVIATSDSAGQTVGTASYSPYGEFGAGTTAPPQHSPFGYTGRQYDVETGLYQYRARYYSPRLGQFLSMDPIGSKDDPDLYLYVGLDPVSMVDPTGTQSADAVRDRIVTEIRSEVNELRGLGRHATRDDIARRTGLDQAADRYSSMDISTEPVAPLDGAAASTMGEGIRGSRTERLLAVSPNAEGDGYGITDTTATRSSSIASGSVPDGAVGLGHGHRPGDNYPGMADPMTVLQKGLPMEYRSGSVGGAIGFDGEYMTLSPVEGARLPNHDGAPQWIKDTFRSWE